eukprot:1277023-Rhodomonas_salina.1
MLYWLTTSFRQAPEVQYCRAKRMTIFPKCLPLLARHSARIREMLYGGPETFGKRAYFEGGG